MLATAPEILRRQEIVLISLNLALLSAIAGIHLLFGGALGLPSRAFFAVVMGRFLMQALELGWLLNREVTAPDPVLAAYGAVSIWLHLGFAFAISLLGGMEDSHYMALLMVPVVAAGFRYSALGVTLVVGATGVATFVQLRLYFAHATAVRATEYFEAANLALVYPLVALVVVLLVAQLRQDRQRLAASRDELARTRDRLVAEERRAAVGQLAAAMAHEIRNPVGTIASSVKLLQRRHPELAGDELGQVVVEESGRLESLTSDFLTYARHRPPAPRPTRLGEVLGAVVGVATARAEPQGVGIRLEDVVDELVEADAFQLQQALLNLVTNAVEACADGGGVVRLTARGTADGVELAVVDNGPPVPPEVVERLFEPFVSGRAAGTGLGLAIARSIAEAHHGALELRTNRTGEVRFVLRLPWRQPAPPAADGLVGV